MRLVYNNSFEEVQIGDKATIHGTEVEVVDIRPPHKPSSTGRVHVKEPDSNFVLTYFPCVIGAQWIEREDRQ